MIAMIMLWRWLLGAFLFGVVGADIKIAIEEAERALSQHDVDLVSLEEELTSALDNAESTHQEYIQTMLKERERTALANKETINAMIHDLESILEAVSQRRTLETTLLNDEELLLEQVQQIETEHDKTAYDSILNQIYEEVNATDFSAPCLTATKAANTVHQALLEYTGKTDVLQLPGTKIIYQMTSPTYESPSNGIRLGDYIHVIPSDWEAFVPGWKEWRMPLPGYLTRSGAPPQAILQGSTQARNCWASVTPTRVVIQLAAPTIISSISIDHVSQSIVDDRSSAPKHFKVYSYSQGDESAGLSFDRDSRTLILDSTYDTSNGASSVQTFAVIDVVPESHGDDASCSTVAPSCESGVTISAAIEVEVLSNWGHQDYTCLYRVRAHGAVV